VWYALKDIRIGSGWEDVIAENVARSRHMVALLGPSSSGYQEREIKWFIDSLFDTSPIHEGPRRFVPVTFPEHQTGPTSQPQSSQHRTSTQRSISRHLQNYQGLVADISGFVTAQKVKEILESPETASTL